MLRVIGTEEKKEVEVLRLRGGGDDCVEGVMPEEWKTCIHCSQPLMIWPTSECEEGHTHSDGTEEESRKPEETAESEKAEQEKARELERLELERKNPSTKCKVCSLTRCFWTTLECSTGRTHEPEPPNTAKVPLMQCAVC